MKKSVCAALRQIRSSSVLVCALFLLVFIPEYALAGAALRLLALSDPELQALPAIKKLPPEFLQDANSVVWILNAHKKPDAITITLTQPETGAVVPHAESALTEWRNAYLFMLDNSGSMKNMWKDEVTGLLRLYWDAVPAMDYAGLYTVAKDLVPVQPLKLRGGEDNISALTGGIKVDGQITAMLENIMKAFDLLKACPALDKHVIIFSDGEVEDKAYRTEIVTAEAQKRHIRIHTVGFKNPDKRSEAELFLGNMRRLAQESNGLYLAASKSSSAEEFKSEIASHKLGGALRVPDVNRLPYGLKTLTVNVRYSYGGKVENLSQDFTIQGTETFDNLLASIALKTGMNPWLCIALPFVFILLLFLLLLIKRSRSKNAALLAEQEQREQFNKVQQEQEAARKLIQCLQETVDKFKPKDAVQANGNPWAMLVDTDGAKYPLVCYSSSIGRNSNNDVVLSDPHVSGEHAILDFKGGKFIWTDRAPTNPTRVNGVLIKGSQAISPGDIVTCGAITLKFILTD